MFAYNKSPLYLCKVNKSRIACMTYFNKTRANHRQHLPLNSGNDAYKDSCISSSTQHDKFCR